MAYIDPMIRQSGESRNLKPNNDQSLRLGSIQKISGGCFTLVSQAEAVLAQRAASCLLSPAVGDVCLFSVDHSGFETNAWIISVLSRAETSPAEILFPQNVKVISPNGSISLEADSIGMKSDQLNINAVAATLTFTQVNMASLTARLTVGTLKTVANYLSLVADRIMQHSQSYSRTTAGLDRTEAPQIEINAQQLLKLKGEYTLVEGERLVKARGAQIHFG
jgi:Protein of unknown function (DUF3540)